MKRHLVWLILGGAILGACALNANPQSAKPQAAKTQNEANLALAGRIVSQGTTKGAVACARCHGYDGASDGSGAFPALAGQPAPYLLNQLQRYAQGIRQNAIMGSIAKGLTQEEMDALAQYYAAARPSPPKRQNSSPLVAQGQQLALVGDSQAQVQACVSCHGPNGEGLAPDVPYLAGQFQHYIKVQIQMFRLGYRQSGQMKDIAHELPDQHLEAIAAYFDQLALPSQK